MEPEVYAIMNQWEGTFWWHVGMQRIIASQLKKYAPATADNVILDAGCGTGGMFNLLAKYGKVYGVDQSPLAIKYAKEKNIAVALTVASVASLPYGDNTFDIVICFDVLYHALAGSDTHALQEFQRVLRPGGVLIIREPAYNWLRGHHDKLVWTRSRYSKQELVSKLEAAGFAVKKASYINFFLFPLALVKRLSERWYPQKDIVNSTFRTNPIMNMLFKQALFFEALLIRYVNFPFGLSVLCVARKK